MQEEPQSKEWQHGYDLDYLKSIESLYSDYNKFSDSPFSKYKKNDVARDLYDDALILEEHGSFVRTISSVKSNITMYGDIVIGKKLAGDVTISKIRGNLEYVDDLCAKLTLAGDATWIYVWTEDFQTCKIINQYFDFVGTKITTFGELVSIYFKDKSNALVPRDKVQIDDVEFVSLKQIGNCSIDLINSISNKLQTLDISFKNHYSNYNKKNTWSAISLRGYYDDVSRIEKPIEMSKKWKEEHKDESSFLQDTELRKQFPEVDELLSVFDGEFHRIRFMRLTPGGGELYRHTDQVDPDSGGNINKLARLHFPIITNPEVKFSVWEPAGNKFTANPKVGEVWFLDTRKPHTVVNDGDSERIHLVVDVVVTPKIKEMILK